MTITVEGRVIPEAHDVSIAFDDRIEQTEPDGKSAIFDIKISGGKITARVELGSDRKDLIDWAVVRTIELATTLVDLHAFTNGLALHVVADTITSGTDTTAISISHRSVTSFISHFSDSELQTIREEMLRDLDLRMAVRDLIQSLSTLNYSAIAACRATESIRNKFRNGNEDDSKAWASMRHALNLSRDYVQLLSDASRQPRHGNRGDAVTFDQSEITHRAWRIMDRYFNFLIAGKADSLPESDFPEL